MMYDLATVRAVLKIVEREARARRWSADARMFRILGAKIAAEMMPPEEEKS